MKYKSGYKYILSEDIHILSPYRTESFTNGQMNLINSCGGYVDIMGNGMMTVRKGYAWDGPSGPAIDIKSFMRGSLFHDVSYQLIREGSLKIDQKPVADEWLVFICDEDGMSKIIQYVVEFILSEFGIYAIDPKHGPRTIEAP